MKKQYADLFMILFDRFKDVQYSKYPLTLDATDVIRSKISDKIGNKVMITLWDQLEKYSNENK